MGDVDSGFSRAVEVVQTGARKLGEHRSEEHTSELQSRLQLVSRLLLEKQKKKNKKEKKKNKNQKKQKRTNQPY